MPTNKERSREERVAAGELVIARDRVLDRMRLAAKRHTADVADKTRDDAKRAAVLAVLLLSGRKLSAELGAAIIRGRAEARMAARRRLRAEVGLLGLSAALAAPSASREQKDVSQATRVARSLAGQWQALALLAVRDAQVAKPLTTDKLVRAFEPGLRRAAATETARAYNGEHRAAALDLARSDPESAAKMLREWSAMLDACEKCWPHDGERVGLDESFGAGDEPGGMHPHCNCVETIVSA